MGNPKRGEAAPIPSVALVCGGDFIGAVLSRMKEMASFPCLLWRRRGAAECSSAAEYDSDMLGASLSTTMCSRRCRRLIQWRASTPRCEPLMLTLVQWHWPRSSGCADCMRPTHRPMYAKEPNNPAVRFWKEMFRLTWQGRRPRLCARTRASLSRGLVTVDDIDRWLNDWQAGPWGR